MAAIDTRSATRCRLCGAPIRRSAFGSFWIDDRDYDSCDDTDRSHEPAAACRVIDEILTWVDKDNHLNVREGDLILRDYRLEVVDRLYWNPVENILVRVELAGHNTAFFAQPGDLVAVRRYLTEETP